MTKITLDAEAFKVLASDTRLQILKSLDARPKTVSELARELTLNKATVHEHLQQLLAGELIKKNEREGRKWVYYALSWKGKSLLHPENTTVLVLLGLAAIGSAGAVVQLGNWLRWWGAVHLFGNEAPTGESEADDRDTADAPMGSPEAQDQAADGAGSGADDSQEAQRAFAADENGSAGDADGGSDSGFWDFLGDGDFWLFAVFMLIATAAVLAAGLVKQRARGRELEGTAVDEAEIGHVRPPGGDR